MNQILQKLQIIAQANLTTEGLLDHLMREFSEFSPADIVAILPIVTLYFGGTYLATYALLLILLEIRRRGLSDGTVSIDGGAQPLNDAVVEAFNDVVNHTVSDATDLVDRTRSIVEGQGGDIGPRELDRVRNIFDYADNIGGYLNEILALLTEGGLGRVLTNIDIDELRTIMIDFSDAFEAFMNSCNGLW